MNGPKLKENLRSQTAQSNRRQNELAAALAHRLAEPPRPGDLFLFREAASQDVEWAVVADQQQEGEGKLLVVPADTNRLAGSADVKVVETTTAEPLTLRGRFGVWLDGSRFDLSLRKGSFAGEGCDQVMRKRRQILTRDLHGTAWEREVDADPEYQDWTDEVLKPARDLLRQLAAQQQARKPEPVSPSSRSAAGGFGRYLGLAASILFVAGLAYLAGWGSRGPAVEARNGRITVLEASIDEIKATYEARLRQLSDQKVRNIPVAILYPQIATRGPARPVDLEDQELIVLGLVLEDPRDYPLYDLEIREHSTGELLWSEGSFVKKTFDDVSSRAGLTILLPRHLLTTGEHDLDVFGRTGDERAHLHRYQLSIPGHGA